MGQPREARVKACADKSLLGDEVSVAGTPKGVCVCVDQPRNPQSDGTGRRAADPGLPAQAHMRTRPP